jgi:16S rRNA (uracil1498-N3)-methyltransferase
VPAVPPRFHVDAALAARAEFELPAAAARHAQVLRLQPGAAITLFDGRGGEWDAVVLAVGRSTVRVCPSAFHAVERELALRVTLAVGMPANERMDGLVEKATELGASVIQPLHCARSVLRLSAERAARRVAHWQAVAQAACEQCGRTRLPQVAPVRPLADWLDALEPAAGAARRILLSPGTAAGRGADRGAGALFGPGSAPEWVSLSGPEGGLTDDEERAARRRGFVALSLGPRILRADTAPLALLARLALELEGRSEA